MNVTNEYFGLLKTWLDALLEYRIDDPRHPTLDGALLCPACSVIHGRCHDAIYPFLCMAELSGDEKYLDAARGLFQWSEYMLCDDGSLYNDSQSEWNGITVFAAQGLYKALRFHGRLLEAEERARWEARLMRMMLWLRERITPDTRTNINYLCSNASAMALAGDYFGDESFTLAARKLAAKALGCISENGLICGEGSPIDAVTPRGVRPVDIGYNVEESLPGLYEYARAARDDAAMETVWKLAKAHLEFMLPDGAWDNSFGTRNFKWTYWGSRTSDGCQALFNALGKTEPAFAQAAYRNLLLYRRCTDGLLYGGPHYRRHGEQPCAHHAFCHAKVLAQVLDEGAAELTGAVIPSDDPEAIRDYPELGTCLLAQGDWRLTLCAGDFEYMKGGHASGGTATLLWNREYGPVIAVANTDYWLKEAHNQQLSRKKAQHRPLHPRLERQVDGVVYAQAYDFGAQMGAGRQEDRVVANVEGRLCDITHAPAPGGGAFSLRYELSSSGLRIRAWVPEEDAANTRFVLPVIFKDEPKLRLEGKTAVICDRLSVTAASDIGYNGPIFFLAPGFEAAELCVSPDASGTFEIKLRAE